MKKEKGITLIALIVTIIIMIILAGVTISLTIGENGIISKAKQAKEQQEIAQIQEKLQLAIAEYEVKMRKETLYSILNTIEGMESIYPDSDIEGPPYTVVIQGYTFLIKQDFSIEYQGKNNGIVPKIESIEKISIQENQVTIQIKAKTEDSAGLKEIRIIKNGIEIDKIEGISGKETTQAYNITGNGTYQIKIIGQNRKQAISEEIEINEINTITGTINAGTVIEGQVLLTINAKTQEGSIKTIEIYESSTLLTQLSYNEEIKAVEDEEYQVENIPFYKNTNYTAKIIDNNGKTITTNSVSPKNTDTIRTSIDLYNLSTEVNGGNTFSNQSINLVNDLTVSLLPIGYYDGKGYWTGPYFAGTFQGNNHTITINGMYTNGSCQSFGIFGMVIGGRIYNLTSAGSFGSESVCGGIAAGVKDGIIENCINKCKISSNSGNQIGGIVGLTYGSTIEKCKNEAIITGNAEVGGVCGLLDSSSKIIKCTNNGTVTGKGYLMDTTRYRGADHDITVTNVGGICGKVWNNSKVSYSYNYGSVKGNYWGIGGISGQLKHSTIEYCGNEGTGTITGPSSSYGRIAGIAGTVEDMASVNCCYNKGIISGYDSVAGIVGFGAQAKIENVYNRGNITGSIFVGGIAGIILPYENASYTNNYLYCCYNTGTVKGTQSYGSINGYLDYLDGNYFYSLTGTTASGSNWGDVGRYKNGQYQGILSSSELTSTILSKFGSNFVADSSNINGGYPILSWQ